MAAPEGLCLRQVHIRYGEVQAVTGVDLEVRRGTLVAVLGTNGGGKSSLLNAVSGFVTPWSGSVLWNGRDLKDIPPHRRVRMGIVQVSQTKDLFPGLTVLDNLRLGALFERDPRVVERRLADVFDLFPQLYERRSQAAGFLSGGEQQMVAVGRALMAAPSILLMDEPTSGLAPLYVDAIASVIRELKRRGVTQVLVEHNTGLALSLTDRFVVLRAGRVVYAGQPSDLPADREQFLGRLMLGG